MAEEARAWRGADTFRLVQYLSDRPDALSLPSSDCPTCVVRLLAALTAVCHGDKVALVSCGNCGRTEPLPTNNGPAGRLCSRCTGRPAKKPCARCGKVAGIYARRPEGGICNPCRNKEPDAKEECADCHRMMISYRRLPDGSNLCQTCAPKNTRTCCRCGRVRRVNALTSDGPVCGGRYSSPARLCGVCGQIVPIVARADGTRPDTCDRCYKRDGKACAICERVRATTSTVAWDRSTATRAALAKSAHVPCAGRSRRSRSSGCEGRCATPGTEQPYRPLHGARRATDCASWSVRRPREPSCARRARSPTNRSSGVRPAVSGRTCTPAAAAPAALWPPA